MCSNVKDRSVRVLRNECNEDEDCYLLCGRVIFQKTENKPWVSGGIVWWDVEASSKLIVDSRTIVSQ